MNYVNGQIGYFIGLICGWFACHWHLTGVLW